MAELENETEIRWVKHDSNAFTSVLGKDVVVLSSANFITFVETSRPDKKEILYNANSEVRGDGIQCLCTHTSLSCFAFAEKCRNPRILILSYPSFEVLKSFESVTDTNYLSLRFSEMEFLVALTGIPDYKIVIWNWRTAEKLCFMETQSFGLNQSIRVSPTTPLQIIQINADAGHLIFWDMSLCYKKTLLNRTFISFPDTSFPPYCFTYGADGDVYFVDVKGTLFSMNSETHACSQHYVYPGFGTSGFIPCVTWHKGGLVFTTPSEVQFFKRKSPEGWTKMWSFAPKVLFRALMSSAVKDLLIGITITNDITIIKGDTQVECVTVRSFGGDFNFLCFVNPIGDFFVTYGNQTNVFNLWSKTNGQKVSQLVWTNQEVKAMESNPKWPYLVTVTEEGSVHVINTYEPTHLMELDWINLSMDSLDAVRFRSQGNQFCVANMDVGEFFLLKVPAKIEVIAYLRLDLKIVDYAVPEKETNGVSLIVLPMSQLCCRSGQTVLLYLLNEKQKTFEHIKDVGTPTVIRQILPSPTSPKELYCIPHRSRRFYVMNVLNGKLISEFVSGHQMKFISIRSDGEYFFTFGIDGLVIVKLTDTKKCATLFSTHHRLAKGIKTLAVDPYASYVITLGENETLVCTYLNKTQNADRRSEFDALMSSPAYKQLLLFPLTARAKVIEKFGQEQAAAMISLEKKPLWLMVRRQEIISLEEQQSKKEKQSIIEEFNAIKKKLSQLLDENLSNVPERQLPIHAFDLDKAARRKSLEDGKAEREKEKQLRLAQMKSLNKLIETIRTICWDSVAVKGRQIRGIFAPVSVQSYALFPESKAFMLKMAWVSEVKKISQFFNTGDFFDPWVPRTASALEMKINQKFQLSSIDVTHTIKTKYEEEQMDEEKTKKEAQEQDFKYVWTGTSTHNFVEVDSKHFSQFEMTTFLQCHQEIHFIESDIKKLMLWFNKNFSETFELKEREMAFVIERNNRFRHIINELNFFNFSPSLCKTQISDPEWAPEENPESILTVKDHEVTVPLYISESAMEMIKKKEAEEEKLRQLMLADDFKEKALITMMDGVLEKLWEDEIKKDVPKPKCMVEKSPDTWTEEDLKAMRAYEEAVRFLTSERERYRKLLEAEWAKTATTVKGSVAAFDEKVTKLHLLKLKVESAIGQEILKCLRIRLRCFERIELNRKKESLKSRLMKNEKKLEAMTTELSKLLEMQNECKNFYENLQNKDKNLDKNFKKEFPDYSAILTEQLYKISKKRPKLLQKAATYSTFLNDMGKCAVSGTKPEYMPTECIQYLKDIDALDAYSNAPASVNQQSWELACKLRRMKIDTELRIRACAIDLADAEVTVTSYQKALKAAKDHNVQLQNELHAVRAEEVNASLNYQIQLVLKKGLVEIPLTGQISDFDHSILVSKATLSEVNKAIHKVGEQKLKAMQKAANFRKGIIYKEWEHKKLRMEIEDLKGQLDTVEKLQVLKELQALLVARARGFSDEKGFLYLENELAKVKERHQKAQTEIFQKIDEFEGKIEKLNAKNHQLDLRIQELNVEVNELNLNRNKDFDKKVQTENQKKMKKVRERSKLVRTIQEQHNEILLLQTELELLRLKTYPTIKYKIS